MPETLVNNEIIELNEEAIKCEDTKTPCDTEDNEKNEESSKAASSESEVNYDLKTFRLQQVLNNNTRNKSIALLGNFPDLSDTDQAIIIFEKRAFQESDVATDAGAQNEKNGDEENGDEKHLVTAEQSLEAEKSLNKPSYFCDDLKVRTEFINNIYGSYQCTPPENLNGVKATVVYPATEKHIEKYSICQKFVINETPELYKEITLPYITSSQFSLDWVYNILEHKQEAERIIFENPDPESGFILLPDMKWDGRNVENLYVLAIIHKRDIKSLRDLNNTHLPLLRNIRTQAAEALESHYGILSAQLRMYFHYQPSFYHLHVHINPVRNDAPGIWCEKSHMLDTVINNLELLPDYYEKASLPFVSYAGNKLLELYEEKITIRKAVKLNDIDSEMFDLKAKKQKNEEETIEKTNDIDTENVDLKAKEQKKSIEKTNDENIAVVT